MRSSVRRRRGSHRPSARRQPQLSRRRVAHRDRVGAANPREIEFPDGALAHVAPDKGADATLDAAAGPGRGWVRRLESAWPYALGALVICSLAIAAFMHWGLPALAASAARQVPPATERDIGERALAEIDEEWLEPSKLDARERERLDAAFRDRIADDAPPGVELRLEFRAGEMVGPNAFALPGGIVVVTDELVEFAEHDDEVLAVLAHEVGHVLAQHSLRQLFESLGVTLVMTTLTGDLSGPASLASAAPAVLLQSRYSRRDEREADAFAFAWSARHGVPPTRMTDLLQRIEAKLGDGGLPSILSTHPSSRERAESARSER